MDIAICGRRLHKELTDPKTMVKAFGDRARALRLRLDVLREASCLADVPSEPPHRRHQLSNDREGQFSVTIKDNWRIVFVPNHDPVPRLPDGGVDLSQVTAIEIIEVVDYHGK